MTGTMVDLRAGRTDAREGPKRLSRLNWLLEYYPISTVVLAPYAVLIIPMALLYHNPHLGFIFMLLGLALSGTVTAETLFPGRMSRRGQWQRGLAEANARHPRLALIARLVTVVSIAADLVGVSQGRGTIFTQVTEEVPHSTLALTSSLFTGWRYLALALLLASLAGGLMRRRTFLLWTAALIATEVIVVLTTAKSEPLISYLSFAVAMAAICGVIRPRVVVVLVTVLLLAWPTLYAVRNEVRVDGGVQVSQDVTAEDRLRFDLQVTRAAEYDVPVDLNQPGLADMVRYGLVPRLFDPGRAPISTGNAISRYIDGPSTSAYTFLTMGTVYFLEGWWGVVLFYLGWAILASLLLRAGRGPGPIRLSLFAIVVGGPFLWTSAYPDTVIGYLQYAVAGLPVLLLIQLTKRRVRTGTPSEAPVRRLRG
ncbi:hypothetical protein ACFY3U_11005 [Micromonospora sp. NPDC000089]|uniref:hypothetical protein n=1 Tax=unclassified Micromonospora TaxID=2617518 RepID=UPI00369AEF18